MKRIYLDHAAATPLDPLVKEAMLPWLGEAFGNPSSLHQEGKEARNAVEQARKTIASLIGAQASEIVFTGSGTESCNLAILGAAAAQPEKKHVITAKTEHHAVLEPVNILKARGYEISYVPVDDEGMVKPQDVAALVRPDTLLVSLMFANNEVGTILPIKEITRAVKQVNPSVLVHTDACQAAGLIELHVQKLGIDLLTINAAKLYGPKGAAALYVKKGTVLSPLTAGGKQESDLRAGTENVAAIAGFAKAFQIAEARREEEAVRLASLRDEMMNKLLEIKGTKLNGSRVHRLANNVNISFEDLEGEVLVVYLDQKGIACSTSAACTTGQAEPSHVLLAMGKSKALAKGALRFTLGRSTTLDDIHETIAALKEITALLRK